MQVASLLWNPGALEAVGGFHVAQRLCYLFHAWAEGCEIMGFRWIWKRLEGGDYVIDCELRHSPGNVLNASIHPSSPTWIRVRICNGHAHLRRHWQASAEI